MRKLNAKAFILMLILIISSSDLLAQTRIRFARGRTSATVSGSIYGGDQRTYVLGARYAQYLSANVSSRNGCVVFSDGTTSIGYTTRSGSNYLYLSNGCGSTTTFTVTVSISR